MLIALTIDGVATRAIPRRCPHCGNRRPRAARPYNHLMAEKLLPRAETWRLTVPAPPRMVYAAMEQMCGTPPYRFEVVGGDRARVVEFERKGFFGQWAPLARRDKDGNERRDDTGATVWKKPVAWVTAQLTPRGTGTEVVVESSTGAFTHSRAVQLLSLLDRGAGDRRTVYRDRRLPPGPVTLVASWAGMLYHLYLEPSYGAPRGAGVHTASRLTALGNEGIFVHVRLEDGTEGYIERDQLVPSPSEATRAAQVRTAAGSSA